MDSFFTTTEDMVPIAQITPFFPPRSSSLQLFFQSNPEKETVHKGATPQFTATAGEISSFTDWGKQDLKEEEDDDSDFRGRCVRITAIGEFDKPKLAFFHGFPDSPDVWKKQVEFFEDEFCIFLIHLPFCTTDEKDCEYEMPFMGFTFAEIATECNEILRVLLEDGEKCHIVGHDFGVRFTNEMVAQDKTLFKTMTLIDVAPQGTLSPIVKFLRSLAAGIIYQYPLIFVYLIARLIDWSVAYFVFFLVRLSPVYWIARFYLSGSEVSGPPVNTKFNPMLAFLYLQKHYSVMQELFNDNYVAIQDSVVPAIPTMYIYGSGAFNNPVFEQEMRKKGYNHDKVGDTHWMFYTNPKEFNQKLKLFLCKSS